MDVRLLSCGIFFICEFFDDESWAVACSLSPSPVKKWLHAGHG